MVLFQSSTLFLNGLGVASTIAGIFTTSLAIAQLAQCSKLDVIPTVGSSSWLGSWWAGLKFQLNAIEYLQEGYDKYKSLPFKVADRYRWIVVLNSRQHMEELRKAPSDELSFIDEANETVQMKYTVGKEVFYNPYHASVVRLQLTRNLGTLYPEMRDEIASAMDEVLDVRKNEWKSVPALDAVSQIVCRTSNRLFVGLPLCRNPAWINLTLRYTAEVAERANIIRIFPNCLAPFVSGFFTDSTTKQAMTLLRPMIEERLKLLEEYGNDWPDKPNDMLSWLIQSASEGPERSVKHLTTRVLAVNFAAILTSAHSLTQALFLLAQNPQYIQPLRDEVDSIVEEEGWTKASVGKMYKIDSFLKESQRLTGVTSVALMRKALKDFTFSDGTFIPKGTSIVAPSECIHHDDEIYENPHSFDPFRFCNMRDQDGDDVKHQFASTSLDYLPFGHGKHSCPGRFFAALELKSMLAHIVASYDVQLENPKIRPRTWRIGPAVAADSSTKVMFRKREPSPQYL